MRHAQLLASLAAAAGTHHALADTRPQMSPKGYRSGATLVGHVYINVASGERIATSFRDGAPAKRGLNPEIWVTDNDVPCADIDPNLYTVGYVAFADEPALSTPGATNAVYSSWGDLPQDTVVDAVQVSTFVDHFDVDADGDGIGDGVSGLGASWSYYDGDNGFHGCFFPMQIVSFTLANVPGNTDPSGGIQGVVFTVDLSDFDGHGATDLSFEIADSDGDPQSAAFHNPYFAVRDIDSDGVPDGDLDGDGLADFSYRVRYIQPGTADLDGDGVVDGDPLNVAMTYLQLSAPRGTVAPAPPTTFTIDDSFPGGSAGSEDAFDVFTDINGDGYLEPYGTFWYGGFSCDRDADGVFEGDDNGSAPPNGPNDYRPFGSFFHALFGPSGIVTPPCLPDLYPPPGGDDQLNFFDVTAFINLYNAADPGADFFPIGSPDGVFNFFDVSAFIAAYNAGCP